MEPREATYERDEVDGPLSDAKTGDEVIKVKKVHDETTETFKKPNPTPSEADVSSTTFILTIRSSFDWNHR